MLVIEEHIVPGDISNIRLVDYAHHVLNSIHSKSGLKKALKRGEVFVDGIKAEGGKRVLPGQLITLIDTQLTPLKVYEEHLEVVFEDEFIAIINKPAGISVSGNKFKTIVNALPFNLKVSSAHDVLKIPRPVHRLDYPTSGLLLIAKTSGALVKLGKLFEQREIKKKYKAIAVGKMSESGTIDKNINGQQAITKYQLVSHSRSLHTDWLSLVDLYPLTGRTHQLRIHLSEFGFPILGDKLYDDPEKVLKGKGLFLAAVELSLVHPILGTDLVCGIEMPQKFTNLVASQNRRWEKYQ